MLSLRSVGVLLQVFVVAGCGKSPSAPVVASSSTTPAFPSASVAPLPSASAFVVQGTVADLAAEYRGTLGAGLGIVARLQHDGGRVTGSYFYEKAGVLLSLKGSADGARVVVDEAVGKGKTGTLELLVARDGTLSGTWTDPAKQRSLPVSLAPIAQDAGARTALVYRRARRDSARVVGSKTKGEKCAIDLEFPEVFGLPPEVEGKINAKLVPAEQQAMPEPCDHAFRASTRYKVLHDADGVLCVTLSEEHDDSLGAHPDSGESPVTVLLSTGADVRLFGDLLGPKAKEAVVTGLGGAVDRVLKQGGWGADEKQIVMDGLGDLGAPGSFAVEKAGLVVCVSLPHVAAVFGGCQYRLPASSLPHGTDLARAIWSGPR